MVDTAVKVTTICENCAGGGDVLGEHGLAMLLEAGGKKILFDTGAGLTLAGNARALGVDLYDLDAVILSHGHYDHTGGLASVVKKNTALSVYSHPDIFGPKYSKPKDKEPKYTGIPWNREEMVRRGVKFCLNRERVYLGVGVTLTGEIPRFGPSGPPGQRFYLKTERGLVEDPMHDDQAVIVETPRGPVVLLGCAHAGLINTLRYAGQLTGNKQIYALLGGTHLLHHSPSQINETVERLHDFGLQIIAPCHCTGTAARLALFRAFGERFLEHRAGSVFHF